MRSISCIPLAIVFARLVSAQYTATWDPNNLPDKTERDQSGTNKCGTGNDQNSLCQNVYLNSLDDFCLWGPPQPNSTIGNIEQIVVSYCSKPGRGTRLFPAGTLSQAHFLITPDYVQVTGFGDFTKIGIANGDWGGELDPHGPDGLGNPHGGLVFSNVFTGGTGLGQQVHEWTNFQSATAFCIRACDPAGSRPATFCQHIYDVLGCGFNVPGNYGPGFSACRGDNVVPMGLYPQPGGGTSTFYQGQPITPPAQPPAPSSQCVDFQSADLYSGNRNDPALPNGPAPPRPPPSSVTSVGPSSVSSAPPSSASGSSTVPSSTSSAPSSPGTSSGTGPSSASPTTTAPAGGAAGRRIGMNEMAVVVAFIVLGVMSGF